MPGNDPDDREHMAAAIAANAEIIVTWNRRDFPTGPLSSFGIQVMNPDDYLCELVTELPREVVIVVRRMSATKRRPPLSTDQLADRFANSDLQNFAVRLKDLLAETEMPTGRPAAATPRRTRRMTPHVPASEVAAYLATHRPTRYHSVKLVVPPNSAMGKEAHTVVLNAVLLELLTVWPAGTKFVIEYGQSYVQALAEAPKILTEIGRITPAQMVEAISFGWLNPANVTARHQDFDSQPVWWENPIREWIHPYDRTPEIAAFLAASVRRILRQDPANGYTIRIFNTDLRSRRRTE